MNEIEYVAVTSDCST